VGILIIMERCEERVGEQMTTVGASNKEFWNHCKLAIDYQMSFGDNNI